MSPADLLLPFFGVLTGLALGALGSGGSTLALPAFVYAAGMPVKPAVATSLAAVGATSLLGTLIARRRCLLYGCPGQEVDARVALYFAGGGLIGSFVGARLAKYLPDSIQMLLFAGVILAAATAMIRRSLAQEQPVSIDTKPPNPSRPFGLLLSLGAGVGMLTGLVGVGGGFLIVPALTLFAAVPVKRAVSTSLWIITANSATGVLAYLGQVPIGWEAVGLFLAFALGGMVAGQAIARAAHPRKLQMAFAVFLILVGLFTIGKTLATRPSHADNVKTSRLH